MISDDLHGKTLVLKYMRASEWRVPISRDGGGSIGDAVKRALFESGLAYDADVNPESIRFEVEP